MTALPGPSCCRDLLLIGQVLAHLKSDRSHLRFLSLCPNSWLLQREDCFCSTVMQLQCYSASPFHKSVKKEISGLGTSAMASISYMLCEILWLQNRVLPEGECISCEKEPTNACPRKQDLYRKSRFMLGLKPGNLIDFPQGYFGFHVSLWKSNDRSRCCGNGFNSCQ